MNKPKSLPAAPEVQDGVFEPGDGRKPAAYWVPIDSLHGWKNNPRVNKEAIPEVAKSLRRFGFGRPLGARSNGELIWGHTTIAAAKRIRLKEVPVRFMDELSEDEAHALALADNKLGEIAKWDQELLGAVINEMDAHGIDMTHGTGFDDSEIEKLLNVGDIPPEEHGSTMGALKYSVVVECDGEREQAMLLEKLEGEGFKARPIIS